MQFFATDGGCEQGAADHGPRDRFVVDDVIGAGRHVERSDDRARGVVGVDRGRVAVRSAEIEQDAALRRFEDGLRVMAVGGLEHAEAQGDPAAAALAEACNARLGRSHRFGERRIGELRGRRVDRSSWRAPCCRAGRTPIDSCT